MNTDPQAIRVQVDAVLADLPRIDPGAGEDAVDAVDAGVVDVSGAIDAAGRRLEQAHQILVDALESVEKG
jgi:hypothetical protein